MLNHCMRRRSTLSFCKHLKMFCTQIWSCMTKKYNNFILKISSKYHSTTVLHVKSYNQRKMKKKRLFFRKRKGESKEPLTQRKDENHSSSWA